MRRSAALAWSFGNEPATAHRGTDDDRSGDQDRVLDDVLAFERGGNWEPGEGLVGKEEQRGQRPEHLCEEQQQRRPKGNPAQQPQPDEALPHSEQGQRDLRLHDPETDGVDRACCEALGGTEARKSA